MSKNDRMREMVAPSISDAPSVKPAASKVCICGHSQTEHTWPPNPIAEALFSPNEHCRACDCARFRITP